MSVTSTFCYTDYAVRTYDLPHMSFWLKDGDVFGPVGEARTFRTKKAALSAAFMFAAKYQMLQTLVVKKVMVIASEHGNSTVTREIRPL